jgi:glycosyltransferase involved in cell wall biosynthesis
VKVAIVYDCLFPNTVGGAERWYRNLAESLGGRHQVTYLTRRQWGDEGPGTPFETLAVSPRSELYASSGRRRIWPPIRFGIGVFWHLLRHGRSYDVVHSSSFPYFSVIGARLALWLRRAPATLIVDWFEVWEREYWRSYLGRGPGAVGFAVQGLAARLPDHSFAFSRLAEGRLRELRHGGGITRLTGAYMETEPGRPRIAPRPEPPDPPVAVFAGRHIPEKRVPSIPPAIAQARRELPDLRCVILGDGPETELTRSRIRELGLDDVIELRGRVPTEEVRAAMSAAACVVHPSEREGYGLVVLESVSLGTPVVLVDGPENAATELVEPGVNGVLAHSADPQELARAVVGVIRAGEPLRRSALDWYERHRDQLSMRGSLERVRAVYLRMRESASR